MDRVLPVYCEDVFTTKDLARLSRDQRIRTGGINRKVRKERKKIRTVQGAGFKPALPEPFVSFVLRSLKIFAPRANFSWPLLASEGQPQGVAPTIPIPFLRPLRSLRLISESDYSYFVTLVPFVDKSLLRFDCGPALRR
jgi:hypothetical protein